MSLSVSETSLWVLGLSLLCPKDGNVCLLDFLMWLGVRIKESAQLAQCHSHIVSTYCMPDTQIYNVIETFIVQDARVEDQVSYSTFRTWS